MFHACVCVCARVRACTRVREAHSQHEVLFPAGLVAAHGDGRALHILHLERHVGVELV